jgi:hypothetical protein
MLTHQEKVGAYAARRDTGEAAEQAKVQRDLVLLKSEFERIALPPRAHQSQYRERAITDAGKGAIIDATYTVDGPIQWNKLRAHFDHVLSERGWSLEKERSVTTIYGDQGDVEACYSKGEFSLSLWCSGGRKKPCGGFSLFVVAEASSPLNCRTRQ